MSSQRFRLHCSAYFFTALTLASVLASPPAWATASEAPASVGLVLNTTVRHPAFEPRPGEVAAARFRVEIPQAGLLALHLTVAGGAQPEPVLRMLAPLPAKGQLRRVVQTPNALFIVAREEGTFFVEVAAVENDRGLPAFKLRSAFQTAGSALAGSLDKEVDPWDDDLDGKKPPSGGSTVVGSELCALGEQDDHGDVPPCATPIGGGKTVSGVLHNDGGDDEDLFRFRLPDTGVIAIEAVSDSALQLVLRDGDGLAVAITRNESGGTPLRLARALAAGRYFLEVESLEGDDAVYVLTLRRPSRP